MTNADLIKILRDLAEDLTGIDPEAHGPAIELCREAADALVDLKAKLANAERRIERAESQNDFLISQLDELIEKNRKDKE